MWEKNHAWSEKICEQEGEKVWWIHSMRRDSRLGQDWTNGTGLPCSNRKSQIKMKNKATIQGREIQESDFGFLHVQATFNYQRWKNDTKWIVDTLWYQYPSTAFINIPFILPHHLKMPFCILHKEIPIWESVLAQEEYIILLRRQHFSSETHKYSTENMVKF